MNDRVPINPQRPTKRMVEQLIDDLEVVTADRDQARIDRDAWRAAKLADPEAEALAACARAIDKLKDDSRRGSARDGMAYISGPRSAQATDVGRILLHLASRYGVELIERPPDPVDHQEEISGLRWEARQLAGRIDAAASRATP